MDNVIIDEKAEKEYISNLIGKVKAAQQKFASYSQEQVDEIKVKLECSVKCESSCVAFISICGSCLDLLSIISGKAYKYNYSDK